MKILRLGVVYGAPPIFDTDIESMGYVELSELCISPSLRAQLKEWNEDFQRTLSDDYPPDSGFKSDADRHRHNSRGERLAALLQLEVGQDIKIEFIPLK